MTIFYDSTQPGNIPYGSHACVYYDGKFKATVGQTVRFTATRWITVLGDYEHCGIADFEQGNAVFSKPGALRSFVKGRLDMNTRARVYCDLSNLQKVRSELTGLDYLVWLATLDGDKLNAQYTRGLWAVQYAGGETAHYDTSVLYGVW